MLTGSIALLLLAGSFVAYVGWELRPQPPTSTLPALVRGLSGSRVTELQKAFDARVRAKFANGIAADTLSAELQGDGFTLGSRQQEFHVSPDSPQLYFAFVEQHGGMCLSNWSIQWRRDALGRAQDINGRFFHDCP